MDVQLPDGRIIEGVPEGTTQAELMRRVGLMDQSVPDDSGIVSSTADALQSAALAVPQLPLGATQRVTEAVEAAGGGDIPLGALGDVLTFLGDPIDFFRKPEIREQVRQMTVGDLRGAQARVGGALAEQKEQIAEDSPIAEIVGDIGAKGLQLAGAVPQGLITGGATFLGLERFLTPEVKQMEAESALSGKALEGLIGAGEGVVLGGALKGAGGVAKKVTPMVLSKAGKAARTLDSSLHDAFRRSTNKLLAIDSQAARDALDTGILSGVAQLSNRTTVKLADRALSKVPFASDVLEKSTQRTIRGIEEGLRRAVGGKAVTGEEAGVLIQEGAGKFIDRFRNVSGRAYESFYNQMPKGATFGVSNLNTLRNKTIAGLEQAPNLRERVTSSQAFRFIDDILDDASHNQGALPFDVLKKWRTRIGEKLTNAQVLAGEDRALLKQLYGALSDDMRSAAVTQGPRALRAFNKANDLYRKGAEKIEGTLQKIVNSGEPERVFTFALQGTKEGGTRIGSIMRSLSRQERDVVRATVIDRMGKATAGQQSATGDVFSVSTLLTNWNRMSPEAKQALFGKEAGRMRESMNTLVRVADRMKDIERFGNPSGTAQVGITAGTVGAAFFEPVAVLGSLAGTHIGARLMSNPAFVRWLAKNSVRRDIGKAALKGEIRQLEKIARQNPDIADEIIQYIKVVGLDTAERLKQ